MKLSIRAVRGYWIAVFGSLVSCGVLLTAAVADETSDKAPLHQQPNIWVKRSPSAGGPVSPGMGYEASLAYDPRSHRVLRWGGHNQGGGGEQNAELWAFDPVTSQWSLREPNTSPPGVCCAQQNVFDPVHGRFIRFAAFSGNHGWQWFREIYLNNSSVWTYDPTDNIWRDMRPVPSPKTTPLRCADWDSDHQVVVVFGGESSQEGTLVYDPHANTWIRMNPPRQPSFRSGGNMAYDAAHHRHVLFGTQFGDDPHTWTYDLRRNVWQNMKPAHQPPTDRNDAVLAYDANSQSVVSVIRVVDRGSGADILRGHLETWTYDAGKNTWTPQRPAREPDGYRNRRRIVVAVPDQNLILLENFVSTDDRIRGIGREQQIWTYRVAEPRKSTDLAPLTGIAVETTEKTARLTWNATSQAVAYAIYRGEANQPTKFDPRRIARVEKGTTTFEDSGLQTATTYAYSVRALSDEGRESGNSVVARAQPHLVEDGTVTVESPTEVRLAWRARPDRDIVGYHVERAAVEVLSEDQILRLKKDTKPLTEPSVGAIKAIGPFRRLTEKPMWETAYTDRTLDLNKPRSISGEPSFVQRFRPDQLDSQGKAYRYAVYAYRVRAVNRLGVEGGPSPFWLTIPAAPQQLFAREDEERCHLKWQANAEAKIQGYRVYRMESPRRNGPGQPVIRLTANPIAEPRFIDDRAGQVTRRYWIVAVDRLGQEGFPSAPAWHYREYRRYYVHFVGEWHQ